MAKKILILAANPLETARLRLDKEVEEIRTTEKSLDGLQIFQLFTT
jgi:hypothetical protein